MVQEVQVSVPIAIIVLGLVEPELELDINIYTLLCFLFEREPLVPKVHTFFEKMVHTPRVFISLVPL